MVGQICYYLSADKEHLTLQKVMIDNPGPYYLKSFKIQPPYIS